MAVQFKNPTPSAEFDPRPEVRRILGVAGDYCEDYMTREDGDAAVEALVTVITLGGWGVGTYNQFAQDRIRRAIKALQFLDAALV